MEKVVPRWEHGFPGREMGVFREAQIGGQEAVDRYGPDCFGERFGDCVDCSERGYRDSDQG